MLLWVIFIHYVTVTSATYNDAEKYSYRYSLPFQELDSGPMRVSRKIDNSKDDLGPKAPSCDHMKLTQNHPFIVLMLYKSSGRFLGMGSIVDKETVLTALVVVRNALEIPAELLTLAGRLNPWWGDNSQVYPAKTIIVHELGVAIVRLKNHLTFNKYVKSIRLIPDHPKDYSEVYTRHWGIFGIPRGTWNVPAEAISRTSIYVMKVETEPKKKDEFDACAASFPDVETNFTVHTCTIANYTFGWGCQGSPTLAVNKQKKLYQIGVVTVASRKPGEPYHLHVKLGLLLNWIKAHTLIGFTDE